MSKKKINCNVKNCRYNDNDEEECTLNEIDVKSFCDDDSCEKDDTICDSFEKKEELDESEQEEYDEDIDTIDEETEEVDDDEEDLNADEELEDEDEEELNTEESLEDDK